MSFDLDASLRRLKPERLEPRRLKALPRENLRFPDQVPRFGREILIDTCVTIDVLQNRAPAALIGLLETRIINHSTVSLAELTHLFGRLDPAHPDTAATLTAIRRTITALPAHRLATPSARAYGEAGILAGMVARVTNRKADQALLNDALLHGQAIEQGHALLTRNSVDFNLLDRLQPGHVIVYER